MKINQGFIPSVTLGNVTISTTQAKLMHAKASNTYYDTFKFNGSNYQVPAGKKLAVRAFWLQNGSTTSAACSLGYADAPVGNGAIPSNAVPLVMGGLLDSYLAASAGSNYIYELSIYIEIPAGKYPYIYSIGISQARFLCEEI